MDDDSGSDGAFTIQTIRFEGHTSDKALMHNSLYFFPR